MKKAKLPCRKARVMRVWWEMDLSDAEDIDLSGELPTPATHPDYFYRMSLPAYPQTLPASRVRRRLPVRLSRTQLRKRLSHAGRRGAELRRTLSDILVGPRLMEHRLGTTVLGWSEPALRNLLGNRAYRAVTRGVARLFLVLDEFGSYAAPGFAELFKACRSMSALPVTATQTLADFEAASPRPEVDLRELLAARPVVHIQLPALPAEVSRD